MLVDLRNHGASAALDIFEPPHDIQAAAQDLIDLCKQRKTSRVCFGMHKNV